jgi:hypothetical protein
MSGNNFFPPFPAAITSTAVRNATTAYPADYLIEHILKLNSYLIDLTNSSVLLGKSHSDPYTPSLHTLFIRLQNKQPVPSRLPTGFQSAEHIQSRIHLHTDKEAAQRPLADYEDLYYALLSRMQEIYQLLNIRIESGFNDSLHVVCSGGPSFAELHTSLTEYWHVFNDAGCGKALDDAVREARVQALRDEIVWQVENDNMSVEDAHEQLGQLYSPEVYSEIQGLHFVRNWAPAIVGAYLEQKYRAMLDLEKQEAGLKARMQRRRARMRNMKEEASNKLVGEETAREECREDAQNAQTSAPVVENKTQNDTGRQKQYPDQLHVEIPHHYMHSQQQLETQETKMQHLPVPQNDFPPLQQHHSPRYQTQLCHQGEKQHQEQSAVILHDQQDTLQTPAYSTDLDMMLQWHMRTRRVSEYSHYLRARASHDAQQVVQETRDTVDGFAFSSNGMNSGVLDPEMDLSGHMEF